jgi:ribosome-associated heat shock protein Hsp15
MSSTRKPRDMTGDADDGEARAARSRIDKWLWCARFYKSRALASEAVTGGKVHVNGERVKASRSLAVGDTLSITQGPIAREVIVRSLPERRGPATEAQRAYEETAESVTRRERLREQQALAAAFAPRPASRPDKRERRLLQRLHRRQT